ncbi:hypothetical protein WBJ53_32740 (plasmid) [Spirosoma sp. SC4-14]|uniref:hypothetical protein n=1 Tax=Spirosoma sp. SC4-14 TaxID=3128900 RepID=UPI0030CE2D11
MERQDPALEPLKILIEELIYNTYITQQPGLVEQINKLIKKGHTPTAIEQYVKTKISPKSQIADHVYLIASFLLRKQLPPN